MRIIDDDGEIPSGRHHFTASLDTGGFSEGIHDRLEGQAERQGTSRRAQGVIHGEPSRDRKPHPADHPRADQFEIHPVRPLPDIAGRVVGRVVPSPRT